MRLTGIHAVQSYTSQVSSSFWNLLWTFLLLSDSLEPETPTQSWVIRSEFLVLTLRPQWGWCFQTVSAGLKSAGFYPDKDFCNLFIPPCVFFIVLFDICLLLWHVRFYVFITFLLRSTLSYLICAGCCRNNLHLPLKIAIQTPLCLVCLVHRLTCACRWSIGHPFVFHFGWKGNWSPCFSFTLFATTTKKPLSLLWQRAAEFSASV